MTATTCAASCSTIDRRVRSCGTDARIFTPRFRRIFAAVRRANLMRPSLSTSAERSLDVCRLEHLRDVAGPDLLQARPSIRESARAIRVHLAVDSAPPSRRFASELKLDVCHVLIPYEILKHGLLAGIGDHPNALDLRHDHAP